MGSQMNSAKRIMSGTHGQVWIDGELFANCYGLQAKVSVEKEAVPVCGRMWKDYKVKSIEGKGSLKLYKVDSEMASMVGDRVSRGEDPRFTIISALSDPDAYGAERVVIKDVSFDDFVVVDWESAAFGKIECPFTFGGYEYLDRVEAD